MSAYLSLYFTLFKIYFESSFDLIKFETEVNNSADYDVLYPYYFC